MKKRYAIVDIETTGGRAGRDRITEVGIVVFDGSQIIDTYQTLINPERSIPPNITRITGITNSMVKDAPKFYEVAKDIVEMTESAIFVAHNVRFDYSFLRAEFKSLGFTFTRRQLCTVRLSRKVFPGLRSYSLGNLIKHFGISVNARHRALDDALATTDVLGRVFREKEGYDHLKDLVNEGVKASKLPQAISLDMLHALPEENGVDYFSNSYGKVVYVGKSVNIKKRVMQHFSKMTLKASKLQQQVADISFELTGSEIAAMLLESKDIKRLQPSINRAQRTANYPYFIHYYFDDSGYYRFDIEKSSKKARLNKNILNDYSSIHSARAHLKGAIHEYELCQHISNMIKENGSCFQYKLGQCFGACIAEEDVAAYNDRAVLAVEFLHKVFNDNFILIDEGRSDDERTVILVEDGSYRGYGFIDLESLDMGVEEIKESIDYVEPNPETNRIVRGYLAKHPTLKKIEF